METLDVLAWWVARLLVWVRAMFGQLLALVWPACPRMGSSAPQRPRIDAAFYEDEAIERLDLSKAVASVAARGGVVALYDVVPDEIMGDSPRLLLDYAQFGARYRQVVVSSWAVGPEEDMRELGPFEVRPEVLALRDARFFVVDKGAHGLVLSDVTPELAMWLGPSRDFGAHRCPNGRMEFEVSYITGGRDLTALVADPHAGAARCVSVGASTIVTVKPLSYGSDGNDDDPRKSPRDGPAAVAGAPSAPEGERLPGAPEVVGAAGALAAPGLDRPGGA